MANLQYIFKTTNEMQIYAAHVGSHPRLVICTQHSVKQPVYVNEGNCTVVNMKEIAVPMKLKVLSGVTQLVHLIIICGFHTTGKTGETK